jgi:hypothetical protein
MVYKHSLQEQIEQTLKEYNPSGFCPLALISNALLLDVNLNGFGNKC